MIRIRQVNTKRIEIQNLLIKFQVELMPYDSIDPVDVGYWWIGYDGDKPVCFAGMKHTQKWNDCLMLSRSGVIKSHRGHGLQKRLLRVRERKARSLGMKWLITYTYNNPASANSILSCGFKTYEPSHRFGATGTIYWRKKL